MGIKIITPKAQFVGYVKNQIDVLIEQQIDVLKHVGALAYEAQMQTRGGMDVYLTQTGNLQSSIGYAVLRKGKVVFQAGFTPNEGTEQGAQGVNEGPTYLKEVATRFQNADLALVIVAGMKYAVYVEHRKLDVLTTAELTADKLLPQLLSQLDK